MSVTEPKKLAVKVKEHFFLPQPIDSIIPDLSTVIETLPEAFVGIAEAFSKNIASVQTTVGIPVTLASASSYGNHWQRIHSVARIESLLLDKEDNESEEALKERREIQAERSARERMDEFASSIEGKSQIATDACHFLLSLLASPELREAAPELLLQGEVLTWTALETFVRDLFTVILNAHPDRILRALKDPVAKKRLPVKFTMEELCASGFNLSSNLGSVLVAKQDFSDLRTMKTLLPPILDADIQVAEALGGPSLWILCQRRHCIVHRRGVVDAHYLDSTGEQLVLGDRLEVQPHDLEAHIAAVGTAIVEILELASADYE